MCNELKTIKDNLKREGFNISYNVNTQKYCITKKGNPLEKLKVYEEFLLDKDYEGVISEYNKMIAYFKEQEAKLKDREIFAEYISNKSVKELTLEEFARVRLEGIKHPGVTKAWNKFWNKLDAIGRRRVRRDFDDITEYVYFLSQIEGKSVNELTLKEFLTIVDKDIHHEGVINAHEKYWDSLSSDERSTIIKQYGYNNTSVYVYSKAISA